MEEKEKKEVKKEEVRKKSWFQGLKSEFKKIVWPVKEAIMKNTVAVVFVAIALGLIISGLDAIIKIGVSFLVNI